MKKTAEEIHIDDIKDSEIMEPRKIFIVGDKKYYADRTSREQLSTHKNCEKCGIKFKKQFTYDKYCEKCSFEVDAEKYLSLPCVEWDETTPVCIWGDDTYFYSLDDIEFYCEDNEVEASQLKLVLCEQTSFSQINIYDLLQDDVHEDWEPDAELVRLEKQLNDYLKSADTNTWKAINKRVVIS